MGPARKVPYSKGMSLGFPARCAMVFTIVALAGAARAEDRRKVAIVGLSEDLAAKALANRLYTELLNHWALAPVGPLDAALFGPFLDEDRENLKKANDYKTAANSEKDQFNYEQASQAATTGLHALEDVTPTKAAPLAADLALDLAAAELFRKHPADAALWLAFVHAVDPARKLDPIKVDPDVVAAYAKAAAATRASYELTVKGSGRVWIDGVDRGVAPGTFTVEAGEHLVQLAGPERHVRGHLEQVQHAETLDIADDPADTELLVARARLALKQAHNDSVSRAPAMNHLAQLLGVHDAVLIWKEGDKLNVQTWRDVAPGFSKYQEYIEDEPVAPLLEPLSPPKPPVPESHDVVVKPQPFNPPLHIEDEPPWYRRRWVQASVAVGVVGAVIGGIVWARHTSHISVMPNAQWDGM